MRRLLTITAIVAAAPANAAAPVNACAGYIGQTISPVAIAGVFDTLPTISPKDAYETTANYQKRLDEAGRAASVGPIMIDRPWGKYPPEFKADKSELPIYAQDLGLNGLNFGEVLRLSLPDAFGNIGFEVTRVETGRSTYEANNGFGAKVMVDHREEHIDAVWEGPLKIGERQFVDGEKRGPIMTLSLDPVRARDIVERGGTALVLTPKAPFRQEGKTSLGATFNSPHSYTRDVRVLWADVRCELIYDGAKKVVATLAVK